MGAMMTKKIVRLSIIKYILSKIYSNYMLSSRGRTLSDEGQQLFLEGMFVGPSKRKLRDFLFSCFHSSWDDQIDQVVRSCRLSTKALYGELWSEGEDGARELPKILDAGITNTVKLILTNPKKGEVLKNYRFFLSVMERAFDNNDHQTAMMMWLALTHMSVERLEFKRPKKSHRIIKRIEDAYGPSDSCFNKHLLGILNNGPSDNMEYLPSLIACSLALSDDKSFRTALRAFGHRLSDNVLQEIKEHVNLVAILCYHHRGAKMKLYETESTDQMSLFNMSEEIPKKKKTLRRTSKTLSNVVQWQDANPVYGKNLPKRKPSVYVTQIR